MAEEDEIYNSPEDFEPSVPDFLDNNIYDDGDAREVSSIH